MDNSHGEDDKTSKTKKTKTVKTVFNNNTPKSVTKLSQISQLQRCFLYSFYLLPEKKKKPNMETHHTVYTHGN